MTNVAQPIIGYKVPRHISTTVSVPQTVVETDEQIEARLFDRFSVLTQLTQACILGHSRALIVSGPPGLGKSYTVEEELAKWNADGENYCITKGYVRSTGLYKLLYKYKDAGQVLVFDDADAVFYDDVSLNLLKTVCDTTEKRTVSWLAETKMTDDNDEKLPRSFDFEGTIIFITNLDFDDLIRKGHKLAPHLQALVSRSHYIDLDIKTKRDYLVRIHQVLKQGMLGHLSSEQRDDITSFMKDKQNSLRELSLRMAIKLASIRTSTDHDWKKVAMITCCRST
jgi:hypothetical protein